MRENDRVHASEQEFGRYEARRQAGAVLQRNSRVFCVPRVDHFALAWLVLTELTEP